MPRNRLLLIALILIAADSTTGDTFIVRGLPMAYNDGMHSHDPQHR